jgi:hypothetical protein
LLVVDADGVAEFEQVVRGFLFLELGAFVVDLTRVRIALVRLGDLAVPGAIGGVNEWAGALAVSDQFE